MRYSKIEITGSGDDTSMYFTDEISPYISNPLSTSKDGLLYYITDEYDQFVLVPENHPIFNVYLLDTIDTDSDSMYKKMLELKTGLNNPYIKQLYKDAQKKYHGKFYETD